MSERTKIVVMEAYPLNADTRSGIKDAFGGKVWFYESNGDAELYVDTPDGVIVATEGDFVIKHADGRVTVMLQKRPRRGH